MVYKSILAGFLIGCGAGISTAFGGGVFGAFLFSFGLISVLTFELPLYTGMIGFYREYSFWDLYLTFLFNVIGAYLAYLIIGIDTSAIATYKLSQSNFFFKGVGCGALMYVAVHSWRKIRYAPVVVCAVMTFILSGFEHCIADIYYFAHTNIKDCAMPYAQIFAGNTVGGILAGKFLDK